MNIYAFKKLGNENIVASRIELEYVAQCALGDGGRIAWRGDYCEGKE
jgi:hypothetical protein